MEIPRVEPQRPHDRLGEIVVDPPPGIAEVEAKLRGEASKLWAEPLVLTMRAVENGRYYSAQSSTCIPSTSPTSQSGDRQRRGKLRRTAAEGGEAEGHQVGDPVRNGLRVRALSNADLESR